MSLETPEPFLTVAFGTPADIGLLLTHPTDAPDDLLTIGWQPKLGTTFLPYDPDDETKGVTAARSAPGRWPG
ncbi:MAG TPA: hypothetical protein VGD29_31020 [Actinoplanes sp.]|jgi:hypothetical protein